MTTMTIEEQVTEQLVHLGERIRATREFRNLTQEKVSNLAGIGLQTLLRIEDGHTGIGAMNVAKVLRVLGLEESMVPAGAPSRPETALHALHIDSPEVDQAIEDAVSAACESLDDFLKVTYPERDGIGSNFQGLLKSHIAAMMCGEHGAKQRYATQLPRLVYSDDAVGGPRWSNDVPTHGWVLRLRGTQKALHEGRPVGLGHSELDPYSSREYALEGFRESIERIGHPPGPVDAVPVYYSSDEKLHFEPPATMQRTSILDDAADLQLKRLFEHVAEQTRLRAIKADRAVEVLFTVYLAVESSDVDALKPWLDDFAGQVDAFEWQAQSRPGVAVEVVEGRDLVAFFKHAVAMLLEGQITESAFTGAMVQLYGATDDGNTAEVQRWTRQGRKIMAMTK